MSATPSASWFMMASAMILATQSASLRKRRIRPPPPEVRTGIVPWLETDYGKLPAGAKLGVGEGSAGHGLNLAHETARMGLH